MTDSDVAGKSGTGAVAEHSANQKPTIEAISAAALSELAEAHKKLFFSRSERTTRTLPYFNYGGAGVMDSYIRVVSALNIVSLRDDAFARGYWTPNPQVPQNVHTAMAKSALALAVIFQRKSRRLNPSNEFDWPIIESYKGTVKLMSSFAKRFSNEKSPVHRAVVKRFSEA